MKVTHLTEEELRAADEAFIQFLQSKMKPKANLANSYQPKSSAVPSAEKEEALSKAEVLVRERWRKLVEMVKKGRLEALQAYWATLLSLQTESENPLVYSPSTSDAASRLVDTPIPTWLRLEDATPAGTILQLATASGQESLTQYLLVDLRADPTLPVPSSSSANPIPEPSTEDEPNDDSIPAQAISKGASYVRKAYDLASTRGVRNIFRRTAYEHPEWYDWLSTSSPTSANVPSLLTPAMEQSDQLKKSTRRKGLKDRMKEREAAAAEAQVIADEEERKKAKEREEVEARKRREGPSRGPQKLGGPGGGGVASSGTLAAMSPEMRARVERERRARAAEARLRTLGGAGEGA